VAVIASRYGVVARTPTQWTWSWTVTLQPDGATSVVSLRIEFLEFREGRSRVVGVQNVCGVRTPPGPPVTIAGTHVLAASAAQQVGAMSATVSEPGPCRGTG
jgi:hypothetical protein